MASKADSLNDIRFSGGAGSTGDRRRHHVRYDEGRPSSFDRSSGNKGRLVASSVLAIGLVAGGVYALTATSTPPLREDVPAPTMTSSWQEESNLAASYALTTIPGPGQSVAAAVETGPETPAPTIDGTSAEAKVDDGQAGVQPSSSSPQTRRFTPTAPQLAPEAGRPAPEPAELAPEAPPGSKTKAPGEAPLYPDPVKTPPDLAPASPENPY